ncbi:MFS transporter [Penicillium brasilianum]|uniref:MFS transporter n=1 Tax=Penicillium brasilianum TaxID=104259 RepID=A0A1S9S0C7_PENBI|nr:MFS transporter [Penicillium brasilianum]
MADSETTLGYSWRSSKALVIGCITIALFSDTFLYAFMVPILSHMLQDRLHIDLAHTQAYTSATLAVYGLVSMVASPIVGHYADKIPNRKMPLLLSLVGCFLGTVMLACAHSQWIFFLGRALQAVGGSSIWVIGLATIADRVSEDHVGKVMGIVMSFVTAGPIAGPTVSGLLFETLGYWPTWTVPFAVLILDFIARLLMVEAPHEATPDTPKNATNPNTEENNTEDRALLSGAKDTYQSFKDPSSQTEANSSTSFSFYREVLSSAGVVLSMTISVLSMFITASFDTTLPLHVQEVFGWGTSTTGLMFFCLQTSSLVLSPLSGWLFDRIGPKYPITVSLIIVVPLIWLLGVAGSEQFGGVFTNISGPAIYIAAIAGIGATSPFIGGIGILELTAFVKERQAADPNVFGPHGGFARAYALSDVLTTVAMVAGPIISGALHATVGYYYMNLVFAIAFVPLPVLSLWLLKHKTCQANVPSDSESVYIPA